MPQRGVCALFLMPLRHNILRIFVWAAECRTGVHSFSRSVIFRARDMNSTERALRPLCRVVGQSILFLFLGCKGQGGNHYSFHSFHREDENGRVLGEPLVFPVDLASLAGLGRRPPRE